MERFGPDGIRFGAGSEYPTPMANPNPKSGVSKITSPKGTRDLYPEDALKRRYLEQCWRDASIRCGFEEIHGPTFETTDLYSVKSGEGILGELFQAYSGKAEEEVEQVKATGRAPYAMRPEFTPTLARMYAAKAGSLPKPCKWFTGGPYFRAERPQRGRLREFLQWNVDVIGGESDADSVAQTSHEVWEVVAASMDLLGLNDACAIHFSDRAAVVEAIRLAHARATQATPLGNITLGEDDVVRLLVLLDQRAKMSTEQFVQRLERHSLTPELIDQGVLQAAGRFAEHGDSRLRTNRVGANTFVGGEAQRDPGPIDRLGDLAVATGVYHRTNARFDPQVVRGLAYYTGMVFELLADGERAIAGGGRYDKLIELMGGPPTPAVGFAMGDVVVSLLLEDKGLMPQGAELMEAVSRVPASVRPEVFVVSGAGADTAAEESASLDAAVRRLSADLRRGVEADAYQQAGERKPWSAKRYDAASGGVRPVHARVSYKSTRNLKKLLADGEKQSARYAAVVHGPDRVQLKDFDGRRDLTPRDVGLSDAHAEFSVDPASPVYVGRAVR